MPGNSFGTSTTMLEHASTPVVVIIFLNYLIYAFNVFRIALQTKVDKQKTFAFGWLSAVFIMCGLCGYVTTFLSQDYWIYREAAHWVLAVLACGLNISGQAAIMADALKASDDSK